MIKPIFFDSEHIRFYAFNEYKNCLKAGLVIRPMNKRINFWIFKSKYGMSKNGMWPLNIWFYKWGIGFHFLTIADCHLEVE